VAVFAHKHVIMLAEHVLVDVLKVASVLLEWSPMIVEIVLNQLAAQVCECPD